MDVERGMLRIRRVVFWIVLGVLDGWRGKVLYCNIIEVKNWSGYSEVKPG